MKWLAVAVLLAATGLSAGALAADPPAETQPWEVGVLPETREQARALYNQANARYLERDCSGAVPLYRQALSLWKHPGIGSTWGAVSSTKSASWRHTTSSTRRCATGRDPSTTTYIATRYV